jgi:hypothetical protein
MYPVSASLTRNRPPVGGALSATAFAQSKSNSAKQTKSRACPNDDTGRVGIMQMMSRRRADAWQHSTKQRESDAWNSPAFLKCTFGSFAASRARHLAFLFISSQLCFTTPCWTSADRPATYRNRDSRGEGLCRMKLNVQDETACRHAPHWRVLEFADPN